MMDLKRTSYLKINKQRDSVKECHKVKIGNKNSSIKSQSIEKSYYKRIKNKIRHFNNKSKDFK